MTDPESLARARAEFSEATGGQKDLDFAFREHLTLDACADMTYLGYVIQESLRLNPVATATS